MTRVRVLAYGVTLDGYSAGPNQGLENPLGMNGIEMMDWYLQTRAWRSSHGQEGGETGVDHAMAEQSLANLGAWILGRNMFGPVRGPWPNLDWKGWWGEEPPYRCPVFVLTHHARPALEMKGGTTFHFVTGGIREALDRAREAAGGRDIRIGGGAATIRQYLRERLVDDLHLALSPVLLGSGESVFRDIDLRTLGYAVDQVIAGERATHMIVRRR
jgi:dihydrofolate reductase